MTMARRLRYTYADYLRALESSELKLEFFDGEIYAMAGGTPAHADLAASMIRLLGNAFAGKPCRVSSSDLKVRIEETGLATFPDVSVVCGERLLSKDDKNAVTNPTLLVEVTSRPTEDYDRGKKLAHYKQCASVMAVLSVSHRSSRVTVAARTAQAGSWQERDFGPGEDVVLDALQLRFAVDDL